MSHSKPESNTEAPPASSQFVSRSDSPLPESSNLVEAAETHVPNVSMNMGLNGNLNMDVNMDMSMNMNHPPVYIHGPTSPIAKSPTCAKNKSHGNIRRIMSSSTAIGSSSSSSTTNFKHVHLSQNILSTPSTRENGTKSRDRERFTKVRVQDLLNSSPQQASFHGSMKGMLESLSHDLDTETNGRLTRRSHSYLNLHNQPPLSDKPHSQIPGNHRHMGVSQSYVSESQYLAHPVFQGSPVQLYDSEKNQFTVSEHHSELPYRQEMEQELNCRQQSEFLCDYPGCHRKFSTSASRLIHQRRTHAPPTAYVCCFCKSSFSTSPNLNKHVS